MKLKNRINGGYPLINKIPLQITFLHKEGLSHRQIVRRLNVYNAVNEELELVNDDRRIGMWRERGVLNCSGTLVRVNVTMTVPIYINLKTRAAFVFIDDNPRPHRIQVVRNVLREGEIERMDGHHFHRSTYPD